MPPSIEKFQVDLRNALTAELSLASERRPNAATRKLRKMLQELETIDTDSSKLVESSNQFPEANPSSATRWFPAAWQIFSKTGSLLPVLEGLCVQSQAMRNANRATRWTFFYLVAVVLAALGGLLLFYFGSWAAITSMHQSLQSQSDKPSGLEINAWFPQVIITSSILITALLAWMVTGGFTKTMLWLGGRSYLENTASSSILRVTQSLVRSGMDSDDALAIGFQLTDANIQIRNRIQRIVQQNDSSQEIGELASYFDFAAHRRLSQLRGRSPFLLITICGGLTAILFCLVVFFPIIVLITDLLKVNF